MKNYSLIDITKFVLAFLVIGVHTFPFSDISSELNLIFIASICRIAVPFFFVASSFFFFQKDRKITSYLKRIALLYLIWTIIYSPFIIKALLNSSNLPLALLRLLIDFFINGSYYHLWFLPALLLAMYLSDKIYRQWGIKTLLAVALILYLVGYVINIYGYHLNSPLINNYLDVFETSRNGLFFGIPYVTIGLLFKEKRPDLKSSLWGLILSVLALGLEIALYYRLGYLTTLSSMYLTLWPLSFFFFALELNISDQKEFKDHKNLRLASSFIYTSHLLFAIVIGPFVNNQLLFYILVALISTISAFILIYLKKYIPLIKYLF